MTPEDIRIRLRSNLLNLNAKQVDHLWNLIRDFKLYYINEHNRRPETTDDIVEAISYILHPDETFEEIFG